MTKEELAQRAMELKANYGHNCAQAVAAALADETNLSAEQLKTISAGFALGMGNMEATCGSLIGAGIITGLKTDGAGTLRLTKQISERFREKCGAVTCKALKGKVSPDIFCPCDLCVKNAVLAYCEVVRGEE